MKPLIARYQDWMSLKTNLLWIYEGKVPTHGKGGLMYPEYFTAYLMLKGKVHLHREEGDILNASAGHWVIPWPGFRHQTFSADAEILSIRFQAHWPDGHALFEQGLSRHFPRENFPDMEANARALLALVTPWIPPDDPTLVSISDFSLESFMEVKTALLRFIVAFANALHSLGLKPTRLGIRDDRICHALVKLDQLPFTKKLRESDLAKEVGLGLSQFVRLFRDETGTTPKKYIESRRRDACERMLATTSVPIKQISLELGFVHPSDFSYWFKKNYRTTPRLFRVNFPRFSEI